MPVSLPAGIPQASLESAQGPPRQRLTDLRRRPRGRIGEPVHPVVGPFSYGSAGARFGDLRRTHVHEGQDVPAPAGTRLVAVRDGIVVEAGGGDARGNHISIYSSRADRTYSYYHLRRRAALETGNRVEAGDVVGEVGCTGRCTGSHLHFEIHSGRGTSGRPLDPLPWLQRLSGADPDEIAAPRDFVSTADRWRKQQEADRKRKARAERRKRARARRQRAEARRERARRERSQREREGRTDPRLPPPPPRTQPPPPATTTTETPPPPPPPAGTETTAPPE